MIVDTSAMIALMFEEPTANEVHRALQLGDCFSYAAAHIAGEPLMFVGDDFTHTDLMPALNNCFLIAFDVNKRRNHSAPRRYSSAGID
jgi:uncharacterized protein with PIN domain